MRTSQKIPETISTIGIDVGKNTFEKRDSLRHLQQENEYAT
jgi:hypothetical protein